LRSGALRSDNAPVFAKRTVSIYVWAPALLCFALLLTWKVTNDRSAALDSYRRGVVLRDAGLPESGNLDALAAARAIRDRIYRTNAVGRSGYESAEGWEIYAWLGRPGHEQSYRGLSSVYVWALTTVGIPARPVRLATRNYLLGARQTETHVTVEVRVDGRWMVSDPTFNVDFGCSDGGTRLSVSEMRDCSGRGGRLIEVPGATQIPDRTIEFHNVPYGDLLSAYGRLDVGATDAAGPAQEVPFARVFAMAADRYTPDRAVAWLLGRTAPDSVEFFYPAISQENWRVVGQGDFDGDGTADVLVERPATGEAAVWFMDGTHVARTKPLTPAGPGAFWNAAAAGDFDADRKPDILWRNSKTGELLVWLMNGVSMTSARPLTPDAADPGWNLVGAGDFDGDGQQDILWRQGATPRLNVWFMNGTARVRSEDVSPANPDGRWNVAGTGDGNGDGKTDIFWRNYVTGDATMWMMSGARMASWRRLKAISYQLTAADR
jgi:hypothetical protein